MKPIDRRSLLDLLAARYLDALERGDHARPTPHGSPKFLSGS